MWRIFVIWLPMWKCMSLRQSRIASIEKEGKIYIFPLIVDFVDAKLEFGIYKLSDNNVEFLNDTDHIQFNNININSSDIFNNKNSNSNSLFNKAADLVKGSISSSTFKIENNKLKIAFAINMSPNGTSFSPHRGGKLITLEIDNNFNISPQIKPLFQNNQSTDNLNLKDELWHGYFANEVIIKHGINSTINNNDLTPFIGMGLTEAKLNPTNRPWFVSVIKNPFKSVANYSFSDTNVDDNDNVRVYRVNNGNSIDTSKGIYSGNGSHTGGQFSFGQFQVGIPILDYNEETGNNNVFERNILFTWNKKQEAIIINQKDHQSNVNALPTYGYHTRLKNTNPSYSELGLTNNFKLINNKQDIANRIKEKLLINNIKNSEITFEKLFFDYENGQIQFKFRINKYFDQTGQLKSDSNLVLEGSIIGFQPIKYEISPSQNLYNSNYKDYQDRNSSVFIASEIVSYNNSQINDH